MKRQFRKNSKRCATRWQAWGTVILPFGFCLAFPCFADAAVLEVEWDGGFLNIVARGVSRSQILKEVTRSTGLKIHGGDADKLDERVSAIHLSGLSLRETMNKLLTGMDYVLVEEKASAGATHSNRHSTLMLVSQRRASSAPRLRINDAATRSGLRQGGGTPQDRIRALQAFANQRNVLGLRNALSDPDPAVQTVALDLLMEIDPKAAIPVLIQAARSPQPETRLGALGLLANNDQMADSAIISTLAEALADPSSAVKQYTIRALAERSAAGGIEYLRQALHDPDRATRIMVIDNAVRSVPPAQRIALLKEATSDPDEMVRDIASNWLEQLTQETRADLTDNTKEIGPIAH